MTQPKFHVTSELSPQRVIFTSKEYNSGLKFQQKKNVQSAQSKLFKTYGCFKTCPWRNKSFWVRKTFIIES